MENTTQSSKKNRKIPIIFGLIVLLVIAWVAASFYTGKLIEEKREHYVLGNLQDFREQMDIISKEYATTRDSISDTERKLFDVLVNLEITEQSYERGIFSSTAQYKVASKNTPEKQIILDVKIDHGPFPLGLLTHFHFMPEMLLSKTEIVKTPLLEDFFSDDKSPIVLTNRVSYNKTVYSELVINPFKGQKEGNQFNFDGGKITSTTIGDKFSGDMHLGRFTLTTAEQLELSIDSVEMTTTDGNIQDFKKYRTFIGNLGIIVNHIDIKNQEKTVQIDNITYDLSSKKQDQYFTNIGDVKINTIKINDIDFGSGQFIAQFDKVNIDKYITLNKAIQQYSSSYSQTDLLAMTQATKNFFSDNPILAMPISWKNSRGEATINMVINFKDTKADQLPDVLLQGMDIDINIDLPNAFIVEVLSNASETNGKPKEEALPDAEMQLSFLTAMGVGKKIVVMKDDSLVSNIHYSNGNMTINGQPIDIIPFLSAFLIGTSPHSYDYDDYDDDEYDEE